MNNKNIYILIAITLFLFWVQTIEIKAESSDNDIYFFLVDISQSMKDVGLDVKVKKELQNFISKKVPLGSSLLIIGFGEKISLIYDDKIDNVEDKERIYHQISLLEFNEDWTHMSAAFDRLAKRLSELHKLYPNSRKYIYIFTDGKNQPPSYLGEKPEHFEEILNKYFSPDEIERKNSFIYYTTFGCTPPEEIIELEEKSDRVYVEETPKEPDKQIIPTILTLELKKSNFAITTDEKEIPLFLIVKSSAKNIYDVITLEVEPAGKIEPNKLEISEKSQSYDLTLSLTVMDIGRKEIEIIPKSEKGSLLQPKSLVVSLNITKPVPLIIKLLRIIIPLVIVLIIVLWYILCPKFTREGLVEISDSGEEIIRWRIKKGQKAFSNKVQVSKDLKLPGLLRNSFLLKIDSTKRIFIKPLKDEITINNINIAKNKFYPLDSETLFSVSGRKFKLARRIK